MIALVIVLMPVVVGAAFFASVHLTTGFAVPNMSLRGNWCVEAWRKLLDLMSANLGQRVLYFAILNRARNCDGCSHANCHHRDLRPGRLPDDHSVRRHRGIAASSFLPVSQRLNW
jgi:hypothetical protein